MTEWIDNIHVGDCRTLMLRMLAGGVRVNCVVTSPPYWGLRDYGVRGQFGLERTWLRHVATMRGVFREVRALLAEDGVAWVNYGDSYANDGKWGGETGGKQAYLPDSTRKRCGREKRRTGLAPKNLVGMPWRIAFALQDDGWILRSDIIWHKPNPMPESIRDRPTKSHEYLFLLAKSERYHYDATAIAEPVTGNAHARGNGVNPKARREVFPAGWASGGKHTAVAHAAAKDGPPNGTKFSKVRAPRSKQNDSFSEAVTDAVESRNARSVWTIPSDPFPGAHFATFPRDLVRRCILAGCPPGGVVFDPFMGSGTVAEVALSLGRHFIGCELNPEYAALFTTHRSSQRGLAV